MIRRKKKSPNKGQDKLATGIEGFDEITEGGLPQGRTTLVMGGPGSGKTIFALQTLANGAAKGEPAIFVAFEENSSQIIRNAASFGWDFSKFSRQRNGRSPLIFFLDPRISPETTKAGTFELTSLLSILGAKAKEVGARSIVFDGMDVLLSLLDDAAAEKREIYRLHEWLTGRGLTGIITAKSDAEDSFLSSRYSFMQFMVDCLVVLYHRFEDRASLRRLCVMKYRGSGSSVNEYPFAIGPSGIEVTSPGRLEMDYRVFGERVSTGIRRFDNMLGGGYYRGTSILISGAPGTGKTTLAGSFAEAACRRGEKALYISFDEAGPEIVRNLTSVSIRLRPYVESGLLIMYSARTEARSADEHLIKMESLIREHQPRALIVDPISALVKVGGESSATTIAQRLLRLAKAQGITMISTTLVEGNEPLGESTPIRISTVADTWIHLSYAVLSGERNRALTIVKSRGTGHSNQVRELVLSSRGVTLADVYVAEGQVLMGTARWQKEVADRAARERVRSEVKQRRRELEAVEAEIRARMKGLKQEMEAKRSELAILLREQEIQEQAWRARERKIALMRGGEADRARKREAGKRRKPSLRVMKSRRGGAR